MDELTLSDAKLLISDSWGIYIPQLFARNFGPFISREDEAILTAGPEHADYWETWDDVLRHTVIKDDKGERYNLSQDGDLWAIPIKYSEE